MKFFAFFVIFLSIFGFLVCFRLDRHSGHVSEDRVFGGNTAEPGQFPYMVSLRQPKEGSNPAVYSNRCGGALLSNRWIVSAAHCYQSKYSNPDNLVAYVGAHHISDDGKMYHLDRITNHPAYNKTIQRADISLLRTADAIEFNNRVQPIPVSKRFIGEDQKSIISGWGAYKMRGLELVFPTHLQVLAVSTLSNEKCNSSLRFDLRKFLYAGSLCIDSQTDQGTCSGDSGSPLVSNGRLIGVVSFGVPCGRGYPDVFTRISTFSRWIQKVTGVVAI